MSTITITRPAAVEVPRGALWAAEAAAQGLRWMSSQWARAGTVAAHFAETQAAAPSSSDFNTGLRERRAEAARVRRMADQLRRLDPRAAADLYAAADRHEH
jgi:hypothetical protein